MNYQEYFLSILEKGNITEAYPFFENLPADNRGDIAKILSPLIKEYLTHTAVQNGNMTTYVIKASLDQRQILLIAGFVCWPLKEFSKQFGAYQVFNKPALEKILAFYCPPWFNTYVNDLIKDQFGHAGLQYDWLMEMQERGFVEPVPELIVRLLPNIMPDSSVLLKRKITLEKHIWYLFEYETTLNWADKFRNFQDKTSDPHYWMNAFKMLSDDHRINRSHLLRHTLLAASKNFHKNLSAWFASLFEFLEPQTTELAELKAELLSAFSSPHSKVQNTAAKYYQRLAKETNTDAEDLEDKIIILLTSDTKSVVHAGLGLLDIAAKKTKTRKENICLLACQSFIHAENDTQTKAAKLIAKYGDKNSVHIKNALAEYKEQLFRDASLILKDFFADNILVAEADESQEISAEMSLKQQRKEIQMPANFDDLLYMISQSFEGNNTFDIDLLPAALISLNGLVKGNNIAKLQPALERAISQRSSWPSSFGNLDYLLIAFFHDYVIWLTQKHKEDASVLLQSLVKHYVKDDENKRHWSTYSFLINNLDTWTTHYKHTWYEPWRQILKVALEHIMSTAEVPLLSTPTHTPAWISPFTLIDRLHYYQQNNIRHDETDLQVAILRCILDEKDEVLRTADIKLKGEYRSLIMYLFDERLDIPSALQTPSAWLIASLTKNKLSNTEPEKFGFHIQKNRLTGDYEWRTLLENYKTQSYDYEKRKQIEITAKRKVIKVLFDTTEKKEFKIRNVFPSFFARNSSEKILYHHFELNVPFLGNEQNDIQRLLLLVPHNPEPLLALVIDKAFIYFDNTSEGEKKILIKMLELLFEIWETPGEMSHLLISACMIYGDKTVRTLAAELWVYHSVMGNLNSALIGEMIGKHEQSEIAPLKRYTDLILSSMFRVSAKHNIELQKLLGACIKYLPEKPILNTKKLLEIYFEVLSLNAADIHDESILTRLRNWSAISGLASITKSLLNLSGPK